MANIERGTRIRERREALHLTQPAVVELLEQAAKDLPETHDLHPSKAGKAPVTLRGYQSYEQGGGIVWEKAKLLAQVLQMDVQAMMNGPQEDTPDPFEATPASTDERVVQLLEAVQQLVVNQNELLARQSAILERIEAAIDLESAATRQLDVAGHAWADAALARYREALQDEPQTPAPARPARAK